MIGRMVSHYKIVEKIGAGGMGVVYKAEDAKLNRTVALKFLPAQISLNEEEKKRFIHEARAAAALNHLNIVTIHEINEFEGQTYIAMEYIEGETIKEKIECRGEVTSPLPLDEAIHIISQIAEGLNKAHKKDIVHRDIKAANIMITADGVVKILDFGLAKLAGRTVLTKEGTTLGTVAYMSPEQAQGEVVDHRTDIWSLGVVLYEMFGGGRPFKGEYEQAVLYSILNEEPEPLRKMNSIVPNEIEKIVHRCLQKEKKSRYASTMELLKDLNSYRDSLRAEELGAFNPRKFLRNMSRPKVAIPLVLAMGVIAVVAVTFFNRQARISWARNVALPMIERLATSTYWDFKEPYNLALEAEKIIPDDPKLAELFSKCSLKTNVITTPPGAKVYMKEYAFPEKEWTFMGISHLENIRLPIGSYRFKIEMDGYETVLAASSNWNSAGPEKFIPFDLVRVLDKKGTLPEGMVRVTGEKTPVGNLGDFFIDRHEVTNQKFKKFIKQGGYRNKKYWKHKFIKDGKTLTWEEAMALFVDQTDQPGPSTWQAGDYPEDQGDHPVSGISWYEAAAFAEFSGKTLPTGHHWGLARGEYTPMIQGFQIGGFAIFAPFSNFNDRGTVTVGSLKGLTAYGAYDMAGNVREWCWNRIGYGRMVRGGAWGDPTYMFGVMSSTPPFDRSPVNGFRCALYPEPGKIPESALGLVDLWQPIDMYKKKAVSDEIFKVYKEQFFYDQIPLKAKVEFRDESPEDWIEERISFDAPYGKERILGVLFLPKDAKPPFQTVVYFPGEQGLFRKSHKMISRSLEFKTFLSFVVPNGRAALYPVYKGMMERRDPRLFSMLFNNGTATRLYSQWLIQMVKDFKRCIDYLETRTDIDKERIAYYGVSWGGMMGMIIPAVEERLKASVLLAGGFDLILPQPRPEANERNFVSRVKIPTLMINGKYDSYFIFDKAIKPMFDLLGTPDEHKKLKLYETDHVPPKNAFIKDTLDWLDKYLGPVER